MAIYLPKRVEVHDGKLTPVFCVLQCFTVAFVIVKFMLYGQYYKHEIRRDDVHVWMWPENDPADVAKITTAAQTEVFCKSARLYGYSSNKIKSHSFSNLTCLPICAPQRASFDCITLEDVMFQEDLHRLFIYTHAQETVLGAAYSFNRSLWHVGVEEFHIGMEYAFATQVSAVVNIKELWKPHKLSGSSTTNILTIIMANEGNNEKYTKTYRPGDRIRFSVQELLDLAGVSQFLDERNVEATDDPSSSVAPIGRISGIRLEVRLECISNPFINVLDWNGPVCYLHVHKTPEHWVYRLLQDVTSESGALRMRKVHGIEIVARGLFHHVTVDIEAISQCLVSLIVLSSIPKFILMLFMSTCLGQLSVVYRKVLLEPFKLHEACGTSILAMIKDMTTFHSMAGDPHSSCISKNQLSNQLAKLFANQDGLISVEQLEDLLKRSCQGVKHKAGVVQCLEELGMRRISSVPLHYSIDLSEFCEACSSKDALDFNSIVSLFNTERRAHALERLFTPRRLLSVVNQPSAATIGNWHEADVGDDENHDDNNSGDSDRAPESDMASGSLTDGLAPEPPECREDTSEYSLDARRHVTFNDDVLTIDKLDHLEPVDYTKMFDSEVSGSNHKPVPFKSVGKNNHSINGDLQSIIANLERRQSDLEQSLQQIEVLMPCTLIQRVQTLEDRVSALSCQIAARCKALNETLEERCCVLGGRCDMPAFFGPNLQDGCKCVRETLHDVVQSGVQTDATCIPGIAHTVGQPIFHLYHL